MERTMWTDERIDDLAGEVRELRREMRVEFGDVRAEIRQLRGEFSQLKLFMLGGYVTLLAAVIGLH